MVRWRNGVGKRYHGTTLCAGATAAILSSPFYLFNHSIYPKILFVKVFTAFGCIKQKRAPSVAFEPYLVGSTCQHRATPGRYLIIANSSVY